MKKKMFLICQILLLIWFFLDMTGVYFMDGYLVTRSYIDDGLFFIIYLVTVVLFIIKDKIGKCAVLGWAVIWFIAQFMSHELVTITGNGYENKTRYFEGALKWLEIDGVYVPDVYHTVLHILILAVIVTGAMYVFQRNSKNVKTK
ncbi:MAG: hypothetical protein IKT10_04015 [Clostridiales bacterium]|nr:hypothetical protein [Clostridiales bacterium]